MMCVLKAAFLPGPGCQEFPVPIEHLNRRSDPLKDVHPVIGIYSDGTGPLERCSFRQLGPIRLILVDEVPIPMVMAMVISSRFRQSSNVGRYTIAANFPG